MRNSIAAAPFAASTTIRASRRPAPRQRVATALPARRKACGDSTQCALTLQALLQRPHTSDELHAIGIYEPRSRVAELRKAGYIIKTVLVAIVDRDGYRRQGVALYTLEGVPCKQAH